MKYELEEITINPQKSLLPLQVEYFSLNNGRILKTKKKNK